MRRGASSRPSGVGHAFDVMWFAWQGGSLAGACYRHGIEKRRVRPTRSA
jgi:hypothetical protein